MINIDKYTEITAFWIRTNRYDREWRPETVNELKRLIAQKLAPITVARERGLKLINWNAIFDIFWKGGDNK